MTKVQKLKGENFYQNGSKLRRLKMLSNGRPVRNASGKIIKDAEFCSKKPDAAVARLEPDRRWFGNTRVVSQASLDKFRKDIEQNRKDPYAVVLKRGSLPLSLLKSESNFSTKSRLLETEPFDHCFGAQSTRKRPKLCASSLEELASCVGADDFQKDHFKEESEFSASASDPIFSKGQSRRIWNELFKVIDSSDVLIHVLDARDPLGTRCPYIESYIKEKAAHKHLVFVLNKSDLIPSKVLRSWIKVLSKERPTLAFHASIKNSFGRGALISLLRQFSKLHPDKKQISVGFVGFPNVGKSSIINTLRQKDVCQVAPIPGQTKVWQYVSLMKRIYLIDCPGVVPSGASEGSDSEKIIRGVVRIEHVETPEDHIVAILRAIEPQNMSKTYDISVPEIPRRPLTDPISEEEHAIGESFLRSLAIKFGKLQKRGEPDIRTVAIMLINDLLRGKIPYFVPPFNSKEPSPDLSSD